MSDEHRQLAYNLFCYFKATDPIQRAKLVHDSIHQLSDEEREEVGMTGEDLDFWSVKDISPIVRKLRSFLEIHKVEMPIVLMEEYGDE